MNVKEVMTNQAVSCRATDTLHHAAQLMWEHDCGALPVVDELNRLVGMVTDRDLCMSTYFQGKAPQDIVVREAMSHDVVSAKLTDDIDHVEELMSHAQVRRIPVVNDQRTPIGMISMGDLARLAARGRRKNVMEREVTKTLAAICTPRADGKMAQPGGDSLW